MNFVRTLIHKLMRAEWITYRKLKCRRLKNHDFTIIASNCVGTFIYRDMWLKYLTPTINLTIGMRDLVKMAGNLRWYMEQELVEVNTTEKYPVGSLGDIHVNFVHYKSFEEAAEKWERRKKRINWRNILLVGTDRDDCDYEVLKSFDNLPYPSKVVFTKKHYPEFSSAYYIKGFENCKTLGDITGFKPGILKRRYMDEFNYVDFLNR